MNVKKPVKGYGSEDTTYSVKINQDIKKLIPILARKRGKNQKEFIEELILNESKKNAKDDQDLHLQMLKAQEYIEKLQVTFQEMADNITNKNDYINQLENIMKERR